jgi:hypothetical protein
MPSSLVKFSKVLEKKCAASIFKAEEAVQSFKTSVNIYHTTWYHIPDTVILYIFLLANSPAMIYLQAFQSVTNHQKSNDADTKHLGDFLQ